MIQRIQTLYWSLAIFLICISFFLTDIISYESGKEILVVKSNILFILFYGCFVVSTIIAVINYKKIKSQLKISKLVIFINILLVLFLVAVRFIGDKFIGCEASTIKEDIGFYICLLSLPLSFLAYSGVKRDQNLLDSLDRLR